MAEDIIVLGIAVETRGVKEGSDALDKLALSGAGAEKATALLATETKKTSSIIAGLAKDYQSAGDSISDALKKLRIRDSSAIAKEANEIRNALNQIKATGSLDDITRASIAAKAAMTGLRTEFDGMARMPKLSVMPDLAPHIAGMNKLGMSANATAAAMRNVPAQFTDIITSLQGGQAPLTVLMQQGGQLKDMFGGVGNAAKAIGGYALGLVNPFTVAAAAAAALGVAYYQGSGEAQAFTSSLILSGNAAGVTAGQLMDMAKSLSESSGATRGSIAETLNEIASSGKISSAVLAQVGKAATDMQKAGGAAASDTVKEFEAIGVSPVAAILKLNEKYHFLTAAVYEQIKALQDQGRETDAANLAQTTYANTLEGRIPGMVSNLGSVERAWKSIVGGAKSAWDAMLNIGREGGLEEQLAKAKKYAENLARSGDSNTPEGERSNSQAQQAIKAIEEKIKKQGQLTKAEVETNKAREAGLKWSISSAKYLDDDAKKRAEILRVTNEMTAAGVSQSEQVKILAKIEESYSTKKSASNKSLKEDYSELFSRQEQEARNRKDAEKELDSLAKANEAYAKSIEAIYAPLEKEAASIELQLQNYGLTRAEIEATTLARLEENRVILSGQEGMGELVANLDREIAARKRIKEASEGIDAKKSADKQIKESKKAAEKAADDWKKTSDKIGDSITDALMRGFESGKGFAETLRDTVVNMFSTMVFRPIIQATVMGGMSAIGLGSGSALANTSSATSSLGSIGSLASGANTAYDMFSSGASTTYTKLAETGIGQSLGLSTAQAPGYMAPVYDSTGALISEGSGTAAGGLTELGSSIGSGLTSMGAGLLGSAIGSAIAGDYRVINGISGSTVGAGVGAAIGSIVPVIGTAVGAVVGGILGGITDRAFGMQEKKQGETGLTGIFAGTQFAGNTYSKWTQKGGWFRSDKSGTDTSPLDSSISDALGASFTLLKLETGRLAEGLGVDTAKIASYAKYINVVMTDDPAANAKALSDAMAGINNELAAVALSGTNFSLANETSSETLNRLYNSLLTVNQAFDAINISAYKASLDSGNMASQLALAMGGLDAFKTSVTEYYKAYFSAAEQQADLTAQVTSGLAAVGVAMPASKEAFRAVVEGLDLTTAAGQTTFAAMMALAPSFATVADTAAASAKTLADTRASLMSKFGEPVTVASATQTIANAGIDLTGLDLAGVQAKMRDILTRSTQANLDSITALVPAFDILIQSLSDVASATKALNDNTVTLNIELLRAQGKEEQALAAERAIAIVGMTAQQVAIYDSNAAIRKQIDSISALATAAAEAASRMSSAAATFKSTFATNATKAEDLRSSLSALGVGMPDSEAAFIKSVNAFAETAYIKDHALAAALDSVSDAYAANLKSGAADIDKDLASGMASALSGTGITIPKTIAELDALIASISIDGNGPTAKKLADLQNLSPAVAEYFAALKSQSDAAVTANEQALAAMQDAIKTATESKRSISYLGVDSAVVAQREAARLTTAFNAAFVVDAPSTLAAAQKMVAALDPSVAANHALIASLSELASALNTVESAAKEAATASLSANANNAYAALERAVSAQRKVAQVSIDAAQEQVTSLRSIFDSLKSGVATLYGQVDSTSSMGAADGQAFIANALATALSSGYMPDPEDLADAVAAAMGGTTDAIYASQVDADRAKLVLAGQMDALKNVSGNQLSVADKALVAAQEQLTSLDSVLESQRSLLDAALGIDVSVLSVADAIKALGVSIAALAASNAAAKAAAAAPAPTTSASSSSASPTAPSVADSQKVLADAWTKASSGVALTLEESVAATTPGAARAAAAERAKAQAAQAAAPAISSTTSLAGTWAAAASAVSQAEEATKSAASVATVSYLGGLKIIPGFAVGANYIPQDMTARIHEGEAIIPKAFNPWANGKAANDDGVIAELKALKAEMIEVRKQLDIANAHASRTAKATNGNPDQPVIVEIAA